MTTANALVTALEAAHAGEPWHGPSRADVLTGITPAQAAWRPAPDAHGIWDLVLHMRSWTREVLRRAQGAVPGVPDDGDWPAPPATPTAAAWRDALASLDAAHQELAAFVRAQRQERLDARVKDRPGQAPGTAITVGEMIRSLAEHDIYHTGQVAMLKRLALHASGGHSSGS